MNPEQEIIFTRPRSITKREYFIAHAPKVVPSWFQPTMPPEPKKPPYVSNLFGKHSDHPDRHLFMKYYDSENDEWLDVVPESLKNEVAAAVKAMNDWANASSEWDNKKIRETQFQWPIFWAYEILKRLQQ